MKKTILFSLKNVDELLHKESENVLFYLILETICYDDACHLKRFACNPVRSSMSKTAEKLAVMEIVCDRFHFKNHTDAWCKRNCNPNTCSANLQVNCLSRFNVDISLLLKSTSECSFVISGSSLQSYDVCFEVRFDNVR